jgi:uncharacterized Zn ribbon protein
MENEIELTEEYTYDEMKEWVRLYKESLTEKELRWRNADNHVEFKEFVFSKMKEGDSVIISTNLDAYKIKPKI